MPCGLDSEAHVYTMYIHMITKVQKWGNSLAVRLPKEIAQQLSLREGTDVEFSPKEDALVIRLAKKQPLSLKDLVAGITTENVHKETDWGQPVGKEAW